MKSFMIVTALVAFVSAAAIEKRAADAKLDGPVTGPVADAVMARDAEPTGPINVAVEDAPESPAKLEK